MKIELNKTNLLDGINQVSKSIPSKSTQVILTCILIEAENGEIKLSGNDLELGISAIVDGEIKENGITALDAKLFASMISKLPDDTVSISTNDAEATIKCGRSKFKLACRDGSDFIQLPAVEKDNGITLNQYTLKEAVRQIIFAVSDNDGNKMMKGVCFDVKGDKLTFTALDGHRIAIREIDLRESHDDVKVVVPGKTLNEISKILSDSGDLIIYLTDKHILIEWDNVKAVSRLIEGEYFDTSKMFTPDHNISLKIDRKGLIEALDRSMLLVGANEKKPVVFDIKDNEMSIQLISAVGSMSESIELEKSGSDIRIGFNAKLLTDALRAIDDDTVNVYLDTPKSPCLIGGADYKYIILPINLLQA